MSVYAVNCKTTSLGPDERCRMEKEIKKLKEMLSIHLDLIQHQADQAASRETQVKALRRENDRLLQKVERMERRLSVPARSPASAASAPPAATALVDSATSPPPHRPGGRSSRETQTSGDECGGSPPRRAGRGRGRPSPGPEPPAPGPTDAAGVTRLGEPADAEERRTETVRPARRGSTGWSESGWPEAPADDSRPETLPDAERQERQSNASRPERQRSASRSERQAGAGRPEAQADADCPEPSSEFTPSAESRRLQAKLCSKGDEAVRHRKCMLTETEYYQYLPAEPPDSDVEDGSAAGRQTHIEIPSWTISQLSPLHSADGTENLDDVVFAKRHLKHEIDEKRRKRWDLRRLREQRQYEKLKQSYCRGRGGRAGGAGGGESEAGRPLTLRPPAAGALYLQVSPQLPVCAFGCNLPVLADREFRLPWTPDKAPPAPGARADSRGRR